VVVSLGLPLWSILKNDERIALLAHELAHVVNGDPTRGLFFKTALDSLTRWYMCWDDPRRLWRQRDPRLTYFGVPFIMLALSLIGTVICGVVYSVAFVLSQLTWREARRADRLAVRIGGSTAMLSLLEKLHFHDVYAQAVAQVTNIWSDKDLFEELARQVAMMPDREIERLRRRALLEPSRLDASHPSTANRIAVIQAMGQVAPELRLSDQVFTLADRQLDPYRRAFQQSIVDHRRRTL
jgi:heat shock protein HtpX